MSNTTTPRTDDAEKRLFCTHDGKFQLLDLSRTLERELNAALAEVERLKAERDKATAACAAKDAVLLKIANWPYLPDESEIAQIAALAAQDTTGQGWHSHEEWAAKEGELAHARKDSEREHSEAIETIFKQSCEIERLRNVLSYVVHYGERSGMSRVKQVCEMTLNGVELDPMRAESIAADVLKLNRPDAKEGK